MLRVLRDAGSETEPVRGYLRSPSRAIVVRYRSTSLLARYASSRRRCPTSLRSPRREWKSCLCVAQVIGESVDSLGEEGNLNLGRTGIILMRAKLGDDRLFLFALQRHTCRIPSGKTRLQTQKNRARLSTQPEEYSIWPDSWSQGQGHRASAEACGMTSNKGITLAC